MNHLTKISMVEISFHLLSIITVEYIKISESAVFVVIVLVIVVWLCGGGGGGGDGGRVNQKL